MECTNNCYNNRRERGHDVFQYWHDVRDNRTKSICEVLGKVRHVGIRITQASRKRTKSRLQQSD